MIKSKPLYLLTIEEASRGLINGNFSSFEITTECLNHIKKYDQKINSFVRLEEDLAIKMAKESDARRAKGEARGVLDGIPYNLKDVYATKDSLTSASSNMLGGHWLAPYNATVYQKLCDAGAVLLGKTNTDEFTMGSSTETSYYGVTRNPWDLERVSGGSSGGPAASVSAHFGIFSIGTDTGGSIRQPASFCGVVGFRPTYGRISRFGELAMASSLDQTGPITKTVRDSAILLQVLSGQDHLDATSLPDGVEDYLAEIDELPVKNPLAGYKIGIAKEYFGDGINDGVEQKIQESINKLIELGAETVPISLPLVKHALEIYYVICPAEVSSNMARYDGIHFGYSAERDIKEESQKLNLYSIYAKSRSDGFGEEVKRRIMLGTHVLSSGYYDAYYLKAERARAKVMDEFAQAFQNVDLLVAPVSPGIAFKVGEKINDPLSMYKEDLLTVPLNIAGIPGVSIPCGFLNELPVGLQLMSARKNEKVLLRAGSAYQSITDYHLKIPKYIQNST